MRWHLSSPCHHERRGVFVGRKKNLVRGEGSTHPALPHHTMGMDQHGQQVSKWQWWRQEEPHGVLMAGGRAGVFEGGSVDGRVGKGVSVAKHCCPMDEGGAWV